MANTRSWVTKSDVTSYLRCPYAFWLVDSGQLSFEDTVDEFGLQLLVQGLDFQQLVEAPLPKLVLSPGQLGALLQNDAVLYNVPTLDNRELRIRGRPDAIDGANGALIPIEVKAHRDIQPMDELELAFYWQLLAPLRTRGDVEPQGRLVLRRDGAPHEVTVELSEKRLRKVTDLIASVRRARQRGVRPVICRCRVCSTLRRDEVTASVTRRRHLSMIYGVAGTYSSLLEGFGYRTWTSLLDADIDILAEQFAEIGYPSVTANVIERWVLHARSYKTRKPALARSVSGPGIGNSYLAVDLEYDKWIWLAGASLVEGDQRRYFHWWADNPSQERAVLSQLLELVGRYPTLPVVTWAGKGADIPAMKRAAQRHSMSEALGPAIYRHRDLFYWAERNLRLPLTSFGLKDVESYFGAVRVSDVRDGLDALIMFQRYLTNRDKSLRAELISYNLDDLNALVAVAEGLRTITEERGIRFDQGALPSVTIAKASLGTLVQGELSTVPRGVARGPERHYRMHYANYRLRSLGRSAGGLDASPEAAHQFALAKVHAAFPGFNATWEPNWPVSIN